ncbi:uncharacterized protein VTP21DRAFT_1432 [Calcarisporiella thermophila]|uniref:uncharacterized protein n=1 Tax=Calcarisporiella thermophila TaxID=911321 RepID=UPI003744A9E3
MQTPIQALGGRHTPQTPVQRIPGQAPLQPPQQQMMPDGRVIGKRPSSGQPSERQTKKFLADRTISSKVETFVPESRLYNELVGFEKKLDAIIMRKRIDIQEAMRSPPKMKRTLRVFISNLASDQPSQRGENEDDEGDVDATVNPPSWTLRIEGRLLEPSSSSSKNRPPSKKFSSFFRSIVVELERDPTLYPEGNLVEWVKTPTSQEVDGFEIKRKGDANVKARIMLHLDYSPAKFKLSPELADLLGVRVDTKPQVLLNLWQYVKNNKLQDSQDKRIINNNERLRKIFLMDRMMFSQLPDLINRHLLPPDPIVLDYLIRVDKDYHLSRHACDIEVELDDALRQKMAAVISTTPSQKEIQTLHDQITRLLHSIAQTKMKRDFLVQFAKQPAEFVRRWCESQSRDLQVILGESQVGLEESRRSEFYRQEWVKEAVFHYMHSKTVLRMQELLNARGQQ